MQQVKIFSSVVNDLNEESINAFLRTHKVIRINNYVTSGYTWTEGYIEYSSRPLFITEVIYELQSKRVKK